MPSTIEVRRVFRFSTLLASFCSYVLQVSGITRQRHLFTGTHGVSPTYICIVYAARSRHVLVSDYSTVDRRDPKKRAPKKTSSYVH